MQQLAVKHKLVLFYVLAFAISGPASALLAAVYKGDPYSPLSVMASSLAGLGPLLSLAILEKLTGKQVQVGAILSTIRLRGANWRWFVPAIFAYPVIVALGNLACFLTGRETQLHLLKSGPDALGLFALPVMAIHFTAGLITSPLFEEPGWRGFALVPLQRRCGREMGSLAVGALWWLWHQPRDIAYGLQPTLYGFAGMVALSFMIDSLFNLSGRNLFTAMLAHQSSAIVITWLYEGQANMVTLSLLIAFVVALRLIEWRTARVPAQALMA